MALKRRTWADVEKTSSAEGEETAYQEVYQEARVAADAGSIIRVARLEAGLTQAALAAAMGITQPAVARLEGGANVPTIDSLVKAARAMGLHLAVGLMTEPEAKDAGLIDRSYGRATLVPRLADPESLAAEVPVEEGGLIEKFFKG